MKKFIQTYLICIIFLQMNVYLSSLGTDRDLFGCEIQYGGLYDIT